MLLALTALLAPTTIALAVNETPKITFAASWAEAKKIGIRATTLPLDWSQIEPKPGEYDLTWPKTAEAFYSGVELGLVLRDLNTTRDERPTDLQNLPYDDPAVLKRWIGMADVVLGAMPKTKLSWIAVGNEVDGVLKADNIAAYTRFLKGAFAHLRTKRPGVRLGTTLMFEGARNRATELRPIAAAGDVTMIDYYLIDAARRPAKSQVPKDLDTMAAFAGDKPLLLTEAGAPSGTVCGSSEEAQRAFIETLLTETRRRKIPYVALQWMNDIGPKAAEGFSRYYGTKDAAFLDYLATLGMRREDGTPKPAWATLAKAF